MSLFRVFVDGELFYDPRLSQLAITQAELKEDAESVDSFTLSAPFDHPYLDAIKPMCSVIRCMDGDAIVFMGRAIEDGRDFYNSRVWVCESVLAYLRDSQQPPYDYAGSLSGMLEHFITEHNKQVEETKRFALGTVTVTDSNDYVHYSSEGYSCTMDAIREKLIDTHGGYLRVRYTATGLMLDYLADFDTRSAQTVEYGRNLLDVERQQSHGERVTALIPLGAEITTTSESGAETTSRVDITSVNDGVHYVYDKDAVESIGWIWACEIWDDVTMPQNLLRKAQERIAMLASGVSSMTLSIVDESDADAAIDDIHARQYVYCKSKPHGIDGLFLCTAKTKDYLDRTGNKITVGATIDTLTSAANDKRYTQLVDAAKADLSDRMDKSTSALRETIATQSTELISTCEGIIMDALTEYATTGDVEQLHETIRSQLTLMSSQIEMRFSQTAESIQDVNGDVQTRFADLEKYFKFSLNGLTISSGDDVLQLVLDAGVIKFLKNGVQFGWWDGVNFHTGNIVVDVNERAQFGNFAFVPRSDASLMFLKVGG